MAKKLAVFDLDGTLLNTIGDLACAANHMLALRGLEQYPLAQYRYFVGNGITRLVERALPEELRTPDYVASARRDFIDYYLAHIDLHTVPYEGVVEAVRTVHERGYALAVASNKFQDGTRKLIAEFFPDLAFGSVYGNREGVPLKPDAALLQAIMRENDAIPDTTYMIGDSGIDMQTATAAATHSIGVTWGFRQREELIENHAEHIIDNPAELLSLLR